MQAYIVVTNIYSFPFRLYWRLQNLTASAVGAVGLVRSLTASPPVGFTLPKEFLLSCPNDSTTFLTCQPNKK